MTDATEAAADVLEAFDECMNAGKEDRERWLERERSPRFGHHGPDPADPDGIIERGKHHTRLLESFRQSMEDLRAALSGEGS